MVGYALIRRGNVLWHRRAMITATVFAALFLIVYVGRASLLHTTKLYPGQGSIRVVYFVVLISHTIIAVLVAPFAIVTLRRALGGRFASHRAVARITFPMWLYTAATGWVVYWMLYHAG